MSSPHICPKCGKDEIAVCPICNKPVTVYSRIVGYLTPISKWNPGKAQEFRERKEYSNWQGDDLANRKEFAERKLIEHQREE